MRDFVFIDDASVASAIVAGVLLAGRRLPLRHRPGERTTIMQVKLIAI